MTVERYIRIIAGSFVLTSLALAHWVDIRWLWFTAFVGVNLFQAGITNWCLMEIILKKAGVGGCCSGEKTETKSSCCSGH